eukprot:8655825-Prorocentrum_lima.AAC.1
MCIRDSVCLRLRGGDPQRDAADIVERRLGRMRATINAAEAWAVETEQAQLLRVAQAARDTWADARM